MHSFFYVFLISIFSYITYFPFLIQGRRKEGVKSILGFDKFSYYVKNLFQNWNVPKICQRSTDNFFSPRYSPYL